MGMGMGISMCMGIRMCVGIRMCMGASETSNRASACDTRLAVPVSRPDLPPFAQALVELFVSGGTPLTPSLSLRHAARRLPPCGASPRTGTGLRMSRAIRTALLSDRALGTLKFGCSLPGANGSCVGCAHGT